jgi:hypothetical protein
MRYAKTCMYYFLLQLFIPGHWLLDFKTQHVSLLLRSSSFLNINVTLPSLCRNCSAKTPSHNTEWLTSPLHYINAIRGWILHMELFISHVIMGICSLRLHNCHDRLHCLEAHLHISSLSSINAMADWINLIKRFVLHQNTCLISYF